VARCGFSGEPGSNGTSTTWADGAAAVTDRLTRVLTDDGCDSPFSSRSGKSRAADMTIIAAAPAIHLGTAWVRSAGTATVARVGFGDEKAAGRPSFRGKQLYVQIYRRKEFVIDRMSDLAGSLRNKLKDGFQILLPKVFERQASADGAVKYLFRLEDGEMVESVYIPEEGRDTLCISSQVGCRAGCRFCMTARMGFRRDLVAGEIVGQVLAVIREGTLSDKGFNVVFMGMGEPLHNFENVMKAFRLLSDPDGIGLSARKITVSTSGIVPVMRHMASLEKLPSLAVSLNAADDQTRSLIMPNNDQWGIEELLQACRDFPLDSRRRITMEYVLLDGINDSIEDAERLASILRGLKVKVNLIAYNNNPGLPYRSPGKDRILAFQRRLAAEDLSAFIRASRGADVGAACGQLAGRMRLAESQIDGLS